MNNAPTAPQDAVLSLDSVSKSFRSAASTVHALKGVSLAIRRGETVALIGPSGSGKSTLLTLAAGLDLADSGTVAFDGSNLATLTSDERALVRNKSIGFVFQNFQLLPTLTALENVMLPLELLGQLNNSSIRESSLALLQKVGLQKRTGHYPVQLSGGEQQRVALARAFVTSPTLLLVDEPTGSLDKENSELALSLMTALSRERGTSILMVTHDTEAAQRMTRTIAMRDGSLI